MWTSLNWFVMGCACRDHGWAASRRELLLARAAVDLDQPVPGGTQVEMSSRIREETMSMKVLAVAGLVIGFAAPAWAGEGDPFRGSAYAHSLCGSCHAVKADETASPNPAAPAFGNLKLKSASSEELAVYINTQHMAARSLMLKPAQADDLFAYLGTLKKGG
jgi:mono/diheme cytochrome c family protein